MERGAVEAVASPRPAEEGVPVAQILHSTIAQPVPGASTIVVDPTEAIPGDEVRRDCADVNGPDKGTRILRLRSMTVTGVATLLRAIAGVVGISRPVRAASSPDETGEIKSLP